MESLKNLKNQINQQKKDKEGKTQVEPNLHFHSVGTTMKKNRVRCKVCNTKTPYICIVCNVHLHPECFSEYHSPENE